MADNTSAILARLVLLDQAKFVSGMRQASGATEQLGVDSEKAGKRTAAGAKSLIKWAIAAGAVYKASRFLKNSVKTVVDLTKSSIALGRITGMDIETSSKWVEMAHARGVSAQQLQVAFGQLAKKQAAANAGTASSIKAFTDLGVSQELVAGGDMPALLDAIANGMAGLPTATARAAAAQALFGRGSRKLLGILGSGSEGIAENLAMLTKYGDYIKGGSLPQVKEMIHAQHEQEAASRGLSLQVGQGLLPAVTALTVELTHLLATLQPILTLIGKHARAVMIFAGAILFTVAALKAYTIYQAAAAGELLLWNVIVAAARKAVLLFRVAMILLATANPWVLLIVGVIALAAALVVLYRKWGWFRNAVQATWSWIKDHWPLLVAILLGPIATATYLVIKHFDKIRGAIQRVIDTAKSLVSPLGKVTDIAGSVLGHLPGLPGFALGGNVPGGGGPVLVGERGPEVVHVPGGARVQPLGPGVLAGAASTAALPPIVCEVYLDRHVLARATAQVAADRLARR